MQEGQEKSRYETDFASHLVLQRRSPALSAASSRSTQLARRTVLDSVERACNHSRTGDCTLTGWTPITARTWASSTVEKSAAIPEVAAADPLISEGAGGCSFCAVSVQVGLFRKIVWM